MLDDEGCIYTFNEGLCEKIPVNAQFNNTQMSALLCVIK